jgi:methylase of polypeptide subunit release factors
MKQKNWMVGAGLALALTWPCRVHAQEGVGDVIYVPTPQKVVEAMLKMVKIGPRDFIIDLGSGDGRMVITAAREFGARGVGVDLDTALLDLSRENAQRDGVAERANFIEQNLFETDLSQATVISSYLLPEMNERLRPKLLNLKPGTRIVAHDYHMGEWYPDQNDTLMVPEKVVGRPGKSFIYMWVVPAKLAGLWESRLKTEKWEFEFTQNFQMIDGEIKIKGRNIKLPRFKLAGDRIGFAVLTKPGDNSTRHRFKGTVQSSVIEGMVTVGSGTALKRLPWSARLIKRGDLKSFEPPAMPQ